ncbi:hypothetical protein GDO86_010906 [Hymenochirus boettgeri]|uniref:Uncharacterized protein n=1 Tax=Hymenochirus boettgeri TaxID=247094 RepID=A0A8T2JH32_9PIPI|nr:hypothetical protein GDO86_010906 [Hymenochirus boettgeri]
MDGSCIEDGAQYLWCNIPRTVLLTRMESSGGFCYVCRGDHTLCIGYFCRYILSVCILNDILASTQCFTFIFQHHFNTCARAQAHILQGTLYH